MLLVGGSTFASGQAGSSNQNTGPTLEIAEADGPYTVDASPFDAANQLLLGTTGQEGFIYEPLLQFNYLRPNEVIPWLATSYAWSDGGKAITFTLRHSVHWSDGQLFTASDVAFTFNLLKKDPALNINGITFSSATALNEWTVEITQPTANYPNLFFIGSQLIVPEHIWAKIKNPATYTDLNPVGTGPYFLKSITPQNYTFVRNPRFWGPKPVVATIQEPGYLTNAAADAALQSGEAQWGGPFLVSAKAFTSTGNGTHHYWFPGYVDVMLVPNVTYYPLNILAFRQAINLVINRPEFAYNADLGEEPVVTNPTGFVLPRDNNLIPPQYRNLKYTVNVPRAKAILLAAHFSYRKGELYAPNGKLVSLPIQIPGCFSDTVAGGPGLVLNLQSLGIQATLETPSCAEQLSNMTTGKFALTTWSAFSAGPSGFYQFDDFLNNQFSAPIGKFAVSNYGRWSDPTTQAALTAYEESDSPVVQQRAMYAIARIMVNDVPLFPLEYQVAWGEDETSQFTGWPTPSNPYATICPYLVGSELVILNLKLKK